MRIRTYFLIAKKKKTINDYINTYFSTIYQTFIPVAATYLTFITRNPLFLSFIIIPVIFKIEVEGLGDRVYPDKLKDFVKRQTK